MARARTKAGSTAAWLDYHVGYDGPYCLIWPFTRNKDGYGFFGRRGKMTKAHRWMCEAVHGAPPTPEHHAAHTCGNGHLGCCHPKHIVWKTPGENGQDKVRHGTVATKRVRRKLTTEQVQHILATRGVRSDVDLAREFGVHHSSIRHIRRGAYWRDGLPHTTSGKIDTSAA